jgi:diguanylate cyclase (GGDEF)-like protein
MKILIAEDDSMCASLLAHMLTDWGYDVMAVEDGKAACHLLCGPAAPQLALLDWVMPGMDGPMICTEIRRRITDAYRYLILLTAKSQTQHLVTGLESGADDYLVKPFEPLELRARLRTGQRIIELHDQLVAAREGMRRQATHDALTGVWNRAAILEGLNREWQRAWRENRPLAVLLVDLDHFKSINDTHGHLTGDAVLCEAARRMSGALRPYDLIGRYGGEEFLILLPGCEAEQAVQVGERLRQRISETGVVHAHSSIRVTASIGISVADGEGMDTVSALLHAADVALYQAKAHGRDRVVLHPSACVTV